MLKDIQRPKSIPQASSVSRHSIVSALLATALDHYNVALYGFMAPVIINLFLPNMERVYGLILAYCVTPLGMLSRPMGAVVIGHIGDKWGRKQALTVAVWGMAIVTGLIGLLPTYATAGLAAPILFAILRLVQDFFLAGGYNGGAIFILEHAQAQHKGLWSGLYCSATVVGILLASLSATIIAYLPMHYWRVPYFVGFFTGFMGMYIRRYALETPEFLKSKPRRKPPLPEHLRTYKWAILSAVGAAFFFATVTKVVQVFMNAFILQVTSLPVAQVMAIHTGALVLFFLVLPLFGKLGDVLGLGRSMRYGAFATAMISFPLFKLLEYDSLACVILMKVILVVLSAWFVAPFHAWMQTLFPVNARYTLISFSYAIGARIGSCMVPLLLYLWSETRLLYVPCSLLVIAAALSVMSMWPRRERFAVSV